MKRIYIIVLLGGALFCAALAWAQSQRYVAEDGVELYDAPSQDANIITMLGKGTTLDVLESPAAGYTHVHTPDNWQGFVISEFLVDSRPVLEAETASSASLQTSSLQMQNGTATPSTHDRPASSTGDAFLKKELAAAQKELRIIREDNRQLRDKSKRDWFLTGAGVLLLGLALGFIVPKIEWRRKSWYSY